MIAAAVLAAATAAPPGVLRVCADPNNMPFSNRLREGFENRLAALVARDLGWTVEYTWWAQRRGFVRNTLDAGLCDVIPGVPATLDRVLATRPYYRSTYVFVTRRGAPGIRSLDDAALRRLRVGVPVVGDDYAATPPGHALAARGIVANVSGYTVYGDYREDSPPSRLVRAVAEGEIDVAVAWGPLAGFFASRQRVPLSVRPVPTPADAGPLPFAFDIAIAVRRGDRALRDALDGVLARRKREVDGLLERYGVPRADRERDTGLE